MKRCSLNSRCWRGFEHEGMCSLDGRPGDDRTGTSFVPGKDIFGQTVSKNSRGKDGNEQPKGPLDLTDEEAAVWQQYGHNVKALCRLILRYREREGIFMRTAPSVVIDLVDLAVAREMP